MFTGSLFSQCILKMAFQLTSPVYSYIYDYQNEFSFNARFGKDVPPMGVTHSDELNSFFKINSVNPKDLNESDLDVSKLMVNVWYKFVSSE